MHFATTNVDATFGDMWCHDVCNPLCEELQGNLFYRRGRDAMLSRCRPRFFAGIDDRNHGT